MSRIFITGDTHGDYDIEKLKRLKKEKLTKDDYLIVLGDWGCIWDGGKRDEYWINWYNSKPYTTLFIDGNHENHVLLNEYPVEEWHGGKVHRIADSVYHLMRGEYYEIDGRTFFTFGGAKSHDIEYRVAWRSWWPGEMPSSDEMKHGLETLALHNNTVDYILTHDAPGFVCTKFNYDIDLLNRYLDNLETETGVQFKHWYFGHLHRDRDFSSVHTGVYNEIIELED